MRLLLTALTVLYSLLCFSQKRDSLRKSGFYCSLEGAVPLYYTQSGSGKYFDEYAHQLQWRKYKLKTPNAGIGYFTRGRYLFFRTELSYWFGRKDASISSSRTTSGFYGNAGSKYYHRLGDTVYTYQETCTGNLSQHNLDWQLHVGAAIRKRFTVFLGFRRNFLVSYSYDGALSREGHRHMVTSYPDPSPFNDAVSVTYTGSDIKATHFQKMQGLKYIDVGLNYLFKIKGRYCFTELLFDMPFENYYEANRAYIGMKAGYFFWSWQKHWRKLKCKKTKEEEKKAPWMQDQ